MTGKGSEEERRRSPALARASLSERHRSVERTGRDDRHSNQRAERCMTGYYVVSGFAKV